VLKKTFLGVLFAVLVSGLLIVGINFHVAKAVDYSSSGTSVGGIISQNTTWTLENSPYFFVDTVTVARNATLTIEPGVTVDIDFWSMRVEGTLRAIGNETHRIKIKALERQLDYQWRIYFADSSTPWDEVTGTGCVIEYAGINFWCLPSGIHGGAPKISSNLIDFTGSLAIATGGIISNNTIIGGYHAIGAMGDALVLFNIIDCMETAISIGSTADSPRITWNFIRGCWNGIIFSGGWTGIPTVANNTVVDCRNGISFPDYLNPEGLDRVSILYNNIYGNAYAVEVGKKDPRITINVTYNWWGTTNTSLIDEKIYDQKDDRRLSLVNYMPILSSPSMAPPILSPIQISTVTQEPEQDKVEPYQEVTVKANVTDQIVGVGDVIIYYSINGGSTWNYSNMIFNETSGLYEGIIPGQPENTLVKYYIHASDKIHHHYVNEDNHGQYYVYTAIKLDITKPTANAGQDQTVSVGEAVAFDAGGSTDNIGIVSYEWDFGDGTTGTGITAIHTHISSGTYTVTLTVKDAAGNTATDTVTITVLLDTDGDGTPDITDPDDDNDGVNDNEDAFPLDPTEWVDTDGDGIGNSADIDNDNDGVPDVADAFPLDASESLDTDGDGVGNTADTDDDGDGMPDTWEIENALDPLSAADASLDPDSDGSTNLEEYQKGANPNVSDAEAFPLWIVGAVIVVIGIATVASVLWKKRKQSPIKR